MADTSRAREEDVEAFLTAAQESRDVMGKFISSLPLETRCQPFALRQLGGFWLPEMTLLRAGDVHARFEPRPEDIFLASFPKSGTTWLKALAFATLNRAEHPPSDNPGHPLRLRSPHECVAFLEKRIMPSAHADDDMFQALPSPRVLATHLPYHLLPERIAAESSGGCRIVYVSRDPKDALVSGWLFTQKNLSAAAKAAGGGAVPPAYPLEEAFKLFCDGRCMVGPQWLHALGYWEESRRRPDKVLFLRYEEMLRDPASNVKRLARFMGRPFSAEEEEAGMVDAVVELCSLDSLMGSKGNQTGTVNDVFGVEKRFFFRKGAAGDWRNHMTPAMAGRLDSIVDCALQGSGLTFGVADNDDSG